MSDRHRQTAQEALWPFGPLARPSYEAQQQLERVAAALAAAEQLGHDNLARKVVALANDWEERGTPLGYHATRALRAVLYGEVAS